MPTTNARYRQQRQAARTILTPEQRAAAAALARYRDDEGRLVAVRPGLRELEAVCGGGEEVSENRGQLERQPTLEQRLARAEQQLAALDRWAVACERFFPDALREAGPDK